MSKKRGFTLIEVVVVIAITTIVLGMVATLFVFMTNSSRELIVKSEQIMLAQSIENSVRGYAKDEGSVNLVGKIVLEDGKIIHNNGTTDNPDDDKVLFEDTDLSIFLIAIQDDFVYCIMQFKDSTYYKFILGEK
ncbi:MAG: type II secretion system protein [Eubacteriales bacterium]